MQTTIYDTKTLGKTICKARKHQGLTQSDLAGLTEVGSRFISDVENGKETAQIGKVLHIMSALGIKLEASAEWMTD